ncbi:unnamed protein product [Lepeophtheirus salmonis]|uniref:(salmon louse) hypothetical protein n=1 Tax=Lepeophtheirus salmonis TaxID=72036 RepID=A0A7R8CYS0_LEPSM|nr:unnamed protein product [Lepeophtheirus salmonis]CAF2971320.1 unnamed protein product [Lepeophtheirus salmonis]
MSHFPPLNFMACSKAEEHKSSSLNTTESWSYNTLHRDRYLFFKAEDDRWKNSVRHNLSMNPHFRKGTKSKHGAGHLWVLADYEEDSCLSAEINDVESGTILPIEEDEATKAVKSILDSEEQKLAAAQDAPLSPSSSSLSSSSTEESVKKGKRKRKYPISNLETYSPSSNTFQKAETIHSSLLRGNHETFVVQELSAAEVQPGQEVFIAEKQLCHPVVSHSNLSTVIHHQNPHITTHQSISNIHPSVLPTVASNVEISTQHIPFSPMEDMEELGVSGYCYEEDVTSLENALGFDFHQKQLLAK